jgi:hypothetical protein
VMVRRLMPSNRSFGPPPSSCRTRFLCQDACSRRWTPVLVIHNCISDFVALSLRHCISDFVASSLHHCISEFVASSLHHCISEFVASSLHHCISEFVASSLRRFVASSLRRFTAFAVLWVMWCSASVARGVKVSVYQGQGVLWCSGCQGPWVPRCSAVVNNFSCLGVKVRGFCCVRGIKVWGSSGCLGPGFLSGGSVVFGVSMSVGFWWCFHC